MDERGQVVLRPVRPASTCAWRAALPQRPHWCASPRAYLRGPAIRARGCRCVCCRHVCCRCVCCCRIRRCRLRRRCRVCHRCWARGSATRQPDATDADTDADGATNSHGRLYFRLHERRRVHRRGRRRVCRFPRVALGLLSGRLAAGESPFGSRGRSAQPADAACRRRRPSLRPDAARWRGQGAARPAAPAT